MNRWWLPYMMLLIAWGIMLWNNYRLQDALTTLMFQYADVQLKLIQAEAKIVQLEIQLDPQAPVLYGTQFHYAGAARTAGREVRD